MSGEARATIVVTPRERFNVALASLDSILERTDEPYELVYVDGRSPRSVARGITERAARHGFEVVRSDRYLTPNEARNLGFSRVRTPYVVFVDNDLLVERGWLDRLIRCAEETGASAVGPLYLEGDPADRIIHMAGGIISWDGEAGRRGFATEHRFQGVALPDAPEPVRRERCDFVEFHCALVRADVLRRIGGCDERLRSTREHLDLCLRIARDGGEVWFEPDAVVTYSTPPPVAWRDVPYFWLRWSESWSLASLRHFVDTYGIDPGYVKRVTIMNTRRQVVFDPLRGVVRRVLGPTGERAAMKALGRVELAVNRRLVREPAPTR